jgi:hypothetical protein
VRTATITDPLGNYAGVGCHNCAHLLKDKACAIRLGLFDDLERISSDDGHYIGRLHDYCPDWESRFVPGFTTANLEANRKSKP